MGREEEGVRGKCGQARAYIVVSVGRNRRCSVNLISKFGIGSLNNFKGLSAIGAVP